MSKTIIKNGCLGVGEQITDFLLEGNTTLPPLVNQDEIRYTYNQDGTPHCTLYASFGAISDLFNYKMTDKDIQEVIDLSVKRGKPLNKGWQTYKAVKCVCDWRNAKYPEQKVLYFRIKIGTSAYQEAKDKNYTIIESYQGNDDYNADFSDDAIVQGVEFPNPTYGHCLGETKNFMKDNYEGRKGKGGIDTNYYKIENMSKLVENKVYYEYCYIILAEASTNTTEEKLKRLTNFRNEIEIATVSHSKMWNLTEDQMFKDRMHEWNNILREKSLDIQNEINKLSE